MNRNSQRNKKQNTSEMIETSLVSEDVKWMSQNLKECLNSDEILKVVDECFKSYGVDNKFKTRRPTHDYIPYITRCCVFNHRNKNNGDVCSENLER